MLWQSGVSTTILLRGKYKVEGIYIDNTRVRPIRCLFTTDDLLVVVDRPLLQTTYIHQGQLPLLKYWCSLLVIMSRKILSYKLVLNAIMYSFQNFSWIPPYGIVSLGSFHRYLYKHFSFPCVILNILVLLVLNCNWPLVLGSLLIPGKILHASLKCPKCPSPLVLNRHLYWAVK